MLIFLLILLVLAFAVGILGAVVKATLILVFSVILAVVILGAVLWFVAKNRMKKFRATLRGYGPPGNGGGAQRCGEVVGSAGERCSFIRVGGFTRAALQVSAAVLECARVQGRRKLQSESRLQGQAVMRLTQQDIARDRAFEPCLEAA